MYHSPRLHHKPNLALGHRQRSLYTENYYRHETTHHLGYIIAATERLESDVTVATQRGKLQGDGCPCVTSERRSKTSRIPRECRREECPRCGWASRTVSGCPCPKKTREFQKGKRKIAWFSAERRCRVWRWRDSIFIRSKAGDIFAWNMRFIGVEMARIVFSWKFLRIGIAFCCI